MPASVGTKELGILRFVTCGSVDDGKSTLIGRLLWESKVVFDDQLSALKNDSHKWGTQGDALDFALLVDGLEAEREQGITIDVAYRFFSTSRRRFVVADSPGHEQYTCNMATAASTAQVAVILIDARKGVLVQTRRHSRIVSMLGIKHVVIAVNKMDLIRWNEDAFTDIVRDYTEFAGELGFATAQFIPISGLGGDNVSAKSANLAWYEGPTLVQYLERIEVKEEVGPSFRMPVQWVNRPDHEFRGYCGRIAAGRVHRGQRIRVMPSGVESEVRSIVTMDGRPGEAVQGQSVTITLADEVDVSRGDVITSADSPGNASDHFRVQLLWMGSRELVPGRRYGVKIHSMAATATVTDISYKVDVNTGARLAAKVIGKNEIARVNVNVDRPVAFEAYASNHSLGAFIMTDRLSGETVGAGMIEYALRRSTNVQRESFEITRATRETMKGQRARCFWFTGLSGSGKSTTARMLDRVLHAAGCHTYVLDGDNVRYGLNRDLGFSEADRVENVRRMAEVAALMVDAGMIVIVSAISPYRSDRAFARSLFAEGDFVEVFVDTPLEICEQRDTKGLYAKARSGTLANLTGVGSPYEAPEAPDVHIKTMETTPEQSAELLAERAMRLV